MRVVSLNVARPRIVMWNNQPVSTGIFKEPIEGRIMLRTLNLDGDRQADLSVHGGINKAVYAYPLEHYDFWRGELPDMELAHGAFGENFTTEGLTEESVCIGDRFRIGAAEVSVTQPRMPCYKLGIKFKRAEIVKRFLLSLRSGFYFAVVREGEVGAGDEIELISRDAHEVSVRDVVRLYADEKGNAVLLRRAIAVEALPESWRTHFQAQLDRL